MKIMNRHRYDEGDYKQIDDNHSVYRFYSDYPDEKHSYNSEWS